MEKFGKLRIDPEKLMKSEELLILKGGYDSYCSCRDYADVIVCTTSFIPCEECGDWCWRNCWPSKASICVGM